jgi:hypothetical protein
VPHRGEVALEVHRDDGVELLLAGVGHHPVAHDAGVVHQNIQTTELLNCGLDEACRLIPVRDVGSVGDGFATGGGDLVDYALRGATAAGGRPVQTNTDVVDDDARTLGREGQRMRATDTAARSGDDDDTAVDHAHIIAP